MKTQIDMLIQQIRTDIFLRKTMPNFGDGPDSAIVRIKTINATQRSFTVETVELLLAELDKLQQHSSAISDVIAERLRQQSVKGFTTQQDDTYICGELAAAAICYIEPMEAESYWPADWHDDSFKPSCDRRDLVKACALLIAEIERLDRQQEAV